MPDKNAPKCCSLFMRAFHKRYGHPRPGEKTITYCCEICGSCEDVVIKYG
jgi:hypothetical protein